jgi:hypothetical protein
MYMRYREGVEKKGSGASAPKRIIFYRGWCASSHGLLNTQTCVADGVSEGQFKQVLTDGMSSISRVVTVA